MWQFQSPLWQTNSVVVMQDGVVVLCDPALRASEIAAIRAHVDGAASQSVHLLLTHADFDHTAGIPAFPEAAVVAGRRTAEEITSGRAAQALAASSREWGEAWSPALRIDVVAEEGTRLDVGGVAVDTVLARGHTADGLAFVLPEAGLLLPGDYLSSMTYPFVNDSVAATRDTYARLVEALDSGDVTWVVPGHGPAMRLDEALAVAAEDIAYLEALDAAATDAVAQRLSPGDALVHVFGAVAPPRATTDDFEVYGLHAQNVRAALQEARA